MICSLEHRDTSGMKSGPLESTVCVVSTKGINNLCNQPIAQQNVNLTRDLYYLFVFVGYSSELSRKHVAQMFFTAELESEARHPGTTRLNNWTFKKDDDRDMFMREVIEQAQTSLYPHSPSQDCDQKGNLITHGSM